MASSNIQKIVQNNFHLNPWVLSKNTNEIVSTCIQKIYKQMPHTFKKDLRPAKVAAVRPENKAPIRTFKSQQECEREPCKIIPHNYPAKKSSRTKTVNHAKLNHEKLIHLLGTSNQNNLQIRKKSAMAISAALSNKKLVKSPNLKIYGSRRYGSSASSSRSSLFRRHDEKRRQRQPYQSQLNFLVRSFHSGHLVDTYAKYLMPARNQQVKANLGSLPEAMKVSSSIQNDLMAIDAVIRNRLAVSDGKKQLEGIEAKKSVEVDHLKAWKHPPPLQKFPIQSLAELMTKTDIKAPERKLQMGSTNHFKNPSPLNELLISENDRQNNELRERHRRNRMKKLGLIKDSPKPSVTHITEKSIATTKLHQKAANSKVFFEKLPQSTHPESSRNLPRTRRRITHFPIVKSTKALQAEQSPKLCKAKSPRSTKLASSPSDVIMSASTSEASTLPDHLIDGPLALATANLVAANSCGPAGYRHNRTNYFSMGKY